MKKNITYTTDVAHCMGYGCPKKDKCYRYWLRKELCKRYVNNTLQSLEYPPHVEEQYDFKTEECEMFKSRVKNGICDSII